MILTALQNEDTVIETTNSASEFDDSDVDGDSLTVSGTETLPSNGTLLQSAALTGICWIAVTGYQISLDSDGIILMLSINPMLTP